MKILDNTRKNQTPSGVVVVGEIPDPPPNKAVIARFAGVTEQHFGCNVTVHDDGTATVILWNS